MHVFKLKGAGYYEIKTHECYASSHNFFSKKVNLKAVKA